MTLHHPLTNLAGPTLDAPRRAETRTSQPTAARTAEQRRDRRAFFWLMAGLTVAHLLLLNPYWVRGGDGEVYLAIGRSLLRGEGFVYNGNPVGLVPPGWPAILAAGMWVSPAMGVLKLLPMASLVGFYGVSYWIVRRFAGPAASAVVIALTASLYPILQLSYWFHSDAAFCLLAAGAVLAAMQINEGRDAWWRVILCALLLAGSVTIRWPGIIVWPMVAGALLSGRRFKTCFRAERADRNPDRWLDRPWVAVALTLLLTFATYVSLRQVLKVPPDQLDRRYNTFMAENYDVVNKTDPVGPRVYAGRLLDTKSWLSSLLWEQVARSRPTRVMADDAANWLLIPLVLGVGVSVWRRQWVWLGMAGYWLPLIVNWTHPIARYIAPIAPLILLAMWIGVRDPLTWGRI